MKFLHFLLIFVLLFVTVNAIGFSRSNIQREKRVSFSVAQTWHSYSKNKQCSTRKSVVNVDDDDDGWKEGLQGYFDGCQRATSKYRGKSHGLADTIMKSFEVYLTKLIYFSNSNSTILSSSCKEILRAISLLDKLDQSSMQVVEETDKIFPDVVKHLNDVALNLSGHIGKLSDSFSDAVDELNSVYSRYVKDFLLSCRLFKCTRKVDFVPTLKKCQKLMNTVALIAETLLNSECTVNVEVQESVLVLTLIFWWLTIAVQGMKCAVQDILLENMCTVSQIIDSSSISFDYVLVSISEAVSAVALSLRKTIGYALGLFVNITMALNTAVKDILGIFEGVTVTVADIARNLLPNLTSTSATKGLTNIVRGLLLK